MVESWGALRGRETGNTNFNYTVDREMQCLKQKARHREENSYRGNEKQG